MVKRVIAKFFTLDVICFLVFLLLKVLNIVGKFALELKDWLHGYGSDEIITCRPADLLKPELDAIKEQYKDIAKTEEDVLSCAMFPQVAPEFIKKRDGSDIREITVDWIR